MKKKLHTELNVAIWLDQESACIIRINEEAEPTMEKIKSGVESRIRYSGEGKVSARFGQSFIDDQEKKQRRQRHQRRRYFKTIIGCIQNVDFVYLFGPGEAKEELNNAMEADQNFQGTAVAIESADRMTEKQMLRTAMNYFSSEIFRKKRKQLKREGLVHK